MSLRWLSKLRWQRMSRLVSLTGSHTMSGQHTQPAPQSIYCTDQTMACQNIACTLQHKESPTLECIHTCCSWFLNSLPNQRLPPPYWPGSSCSVFQEAGGSSATSISIFTTEVIHGSWDSILSQLRQQPDLDLSLSVSCSRKVLSHSFGSVFQNHTFIVS